MNILQQLPLGYTVIDIPYRFAQPITNKALKSLYFCDSCNGWIEGYPLTKTIAGIQKPGYACLLCNGEVGVLRKKI